MARDEVANRQAISSEIAGSGLATLQTYQKTSDMDLWSTNEFVLQRRRSSSWLSEGQAHICQMLPPSMNNSTNAAMPKSTARPRGQPD